MGQSQFNWWTENRDNLQIVKFNCLPQSQISMDLLIWSESVRSDPLTLQRVHSVGFRSSTKGASKEEMSTNHRQAEGQQHSHLGKQVSFDMFHLSFMDKRTSRHSREAVQKRLEVEARQELTFRPKMVAKKQISSMVYPNSGYVLQHSPERIVHWLLSLVLLLAHGPHS